MWDKSTRQNLPGEKAFPVVARPGVLGLTAQKVWDNPSNIPATAKLLITNKTASATTFSLYVVDDGGSPTDNDLIAKLVPLAAHETMSYPDGVLLVPEHGEVWALAGGASAVILYFQGWYYP